MPSVLVLVFALQSGGWQCQENDRGLWECRVPTRTVTTTTTRPEPTPAAPAAASAPSSAESKGPVPSAVRSPASTAEAPSGREWVPKASEAAAGPETPPAALAPTGAADPGSGADATRPDGSPQMPAGPESPAEAFNKFLVQVGAFRSEQRARRAVREFGLPQLAIIPMQRGDEAWYVLLLGSYPDIEAAKSAGQSFMEAHPDASYWVRNAAELRTVKP